LLPIVWALKNLRNDWHGAIGISDKNPNVEIKTWYSFIERFTRKVIYKPGTTNVVADALSRIQKNNITNSDIDILLKVVLKM